MTSVPLERKPKFVCWFMRTTSWPLSLLPSLWYLPLRTRHAGLLSFPPGLRVCSHFRTWTQDGSFTWDLLPLISIGIISPCHSASTWSVTSSELSFPNTPSEGFPSTLSLCKKLTLDLTFKIVFSTLNYYQKITLYIHLLISYIPHWNKTSTRAQTMPSVNAIFPLN